MSAGGINVQQPIGGVPPTQVGGVQPTGGQLDASAVGAAQQGVLTSPNATTGTAFVPTAASAPQGVGGPSELQQAAVVSGGGPGTVQQGVQQQRGPAAWSEAWAAKFKEVGAPAEIIQQLTFSGAMGADEAQLQQVYDQIKSEIDTQLAQFAHDHPDAFKKLRGNKGVDRAMLAQVAAGVNSGQVTAEQLEEFVNSAGKSQGRLIFDQFIKPMVVWSVVPGWGAIRLAFAPFTGGKDPLTGEKMFGDPMSTAFSIMAGIGGGITLFNHARGAMQVAQGHALVRAGGDAAAIAAKEGFGNLTALQKLQSYLPGTNANKVFSGISRFDKDLQNGLKALKAGSVERQLAENALAKWRAGEISVHGAPASKLTKLGFQPNTRGMVIGRNKALVEIVTHNGKPTLLLDGRMTGKTTIAHIASAGVELADDTLANNFLKSRVFQGKGSPLDPSVVKALREEVLGNATKQLLDAKFLTQPTGINKLLGHVRPGPLQDALWAADNVATGAIGKLHGTAAIPKMAKFGIFGAAAAAGGWYMMVKAPADAAKKQEEELAKAQQAQAGAAGGQVTPELQAALQQFAALPAEQQQQILQQQYATLQQAASRTDLTPEQQQQLAAAVNELELFMQVANGGAGAQQAPAAGQAPAAAAAPAGAAAPQFTAKGLGLG